MIDVRQQPGAGQANLAFRVGADLGVPAARQSHLCENGLFSTPLFWTCVSRHSRKSCVLTRLDWLLLQHPTLTPAVTVLCCYCAGGAPTQEAVAALTEALGRQLAGGNALRCADAFKQPTAELIYSIPAVTTCMAIMYDHIQPRASASGPQNSIYLMTDGLQQQSKPGTGQQ